MFNDEVKQRQETFNNSIQVITKKWPLVKKDSGIFREEIAHEFFQTNPHRRQLFETASFTNGTTENVIEKKLLKHSTAVINCLEAIVDMVNGNEESKPMYFVLGKKHKNLTVNEKMFLEMKDAICKVMERRLSPRVSASWGTVLDHIYRNYVFPGMQMIETISS